MEDGPIKVNPSGLLISEAILATNLLMDTPAEAVRCNSSLMACLICLAISIAEQILSLSLVTSRYASSLYQIGIPAEYFADVLRGFFIRRETRANKYSMRTKL